MRTLGKGLLVLFAATISVGCVAQGEVDRLTAKNNELKDQIEDLRYRLNTANNTIEAMRKAPPKQDPELVAALRAYEQQLEDQRQQYETLIGKYKDRIRELAQPSADLPLLPKELDDALVALAERNPDLMTYDPKRGMIEIASDLTFALGKTELRDPAVASLRQLANILKSSAAENFEVRVVGHTDNVPVTNPANKQKYEDNWGLSAFRAIAVMRVLVGAGVEPSKVAIVGHGQYRPEVPNVEKGARENRRVEIYLVPSTYSGMSGGGTSGGTIENGSTDTPPPPPPPLPGK